MTNVEAANRHVDKADVQRLQTLRSQIEALEKTGLEDKTNEYNVKICKLERIVSDARDKLDFVEKTVATSPRVSEVQSKELVDARNRYSRLSSETEESKNASASLKEDLVVLRRLRKDEQQLLQAIFSQPEWREHPKIQELHDEINNIQGSLHNHNVQMASMNTARALLEMAMRYCRQAMQGPADLQQLNGCINSVQEVYGRAENSMPELGSMVHGKVSWEMCSTVEDGRDRIATVEACVADCHGQVVEAVKRAQDVKHREEEVLIEKQEALREIQRKIVMEQ
jgi:chromosome segregation ATPase